MPKKLQLGPVGEPATSEEFFEAIAEGDSKKAADALRRIDQLGPSDLQLLADLISGDPALAKLFPFRIKFARRTPGKPSDKLAKSATAFQIARAVDHELTKCGKLEAAVETVGDRTGRSRATIFRALKLDKKTWFKPPESH
jgi:hypothetical protein